ncbi:MAG: MFS transporter [Candidatus Thorarchaeota archaeon]
MSLAPELVRSEEAILSSGLSTRRTFLSLNSVLWRLALVTGIAQLSVSIWIWQFALTLESFLPPFEIGLTFAVGSLAALLGYPLSGILADKIGRKNSLVISFIPQIAGILLLFLFPLWPLVLFAYGLQSFGWSFVLVISRAIPADEINLDSGTDATRKMTMVLMPSFVVDGISPILAVILLYSGFALPSLLLIGVLAAVFAMLFSATQIKETLVNATEPAPKMQITDTLRSLGRSFWKFTAAMVGYYLAWGMAIPYIGILSVRECGVSLEVYGIASSVFSLASVSMMYTLSGIAGKRTKSGLVISLAGNSVVMTALGLGSEAWLLILLNMLWAAPIVVWIATEVILTVNGVPSNMKGRALGIYQLAISITGLMAAPVGAYIWTYSGSLRFLWVVSGILAISFTSVAWWVLKRVKIRTVTKIMI